MKTNLKKAIASSALACAVSFSLPMGAYAVHDEGGSAVMELPASVAEAPVPRQGMATFPVVLFEAPGQRAVSETLASALSVTVIDVEDDSIAGIAEQMSRHKHQLQVRNLKNVGYYKVIVNGIPDGFELVPADVQAVSNGLVTVAQDDMLVYDDENKYHALTRYIALRETYELKAKEGVEARLNDPVPEPGSLIENSADMPDGTTFEYVSMPEMGVEGRTSAVVKATFPNLYTTQIEVYIDVVAESEVPDDVDGGIVGPDQSGDSGKDGNAGQASSKAPDPVASAKALPKTGDAGSIAALGAVGASCAAGAGLALSRKRRREPEADI